jgi:4-coumarate--CoA ligase
LTSQWKSHGGHLDDKVSIVDGTTGLQRTFREHHALTAALAATFYHDMNIQTEADTVAMYCPNHVDYLPVILAVSLCGAKVTPVNPLYTRSELDVVLERSRAAVLVAHESKREVALAAAAQSPHVRQVIFVTDGDRGAPLVEGTVHLDAIRQSGHAQAFTDTHYAVHPATHSHSLILPYSSGTTGLPKGVCLTHENIVANLLQCEQIEGPSFSQDHKLISPLPFFHIYAFTVSMLYTAWKGQTVITNSGRFDLESFCRLVEEHRPQRAHLVPPILLGLAKSPLVDQYDLSSLEMIVSAAAPLGSDVEEAVQKRLGCGVKQAWVSAKQQNDRCRLLSEPWVLTLPRRLLRECPN